MGLTVQATDGAMLPLDSLFQTFGYTGANLTTITVVYAGITYVQTLTYSGSDVATISNWIAQAAGYDYFDLLAIDGEGNSLPFILLNGQNLLLTP